MEGKSNEGVPPLLTTPQDLANAIPGVVKIGVEAAKDDRVAAIIIAAFGDPGLEELRAEVDVPVFGIREQAFHEAARDGRPFGVATTTPDPGLLEGFRQYRRRARLRGPVSRHPRHARRSERADGEVARRARRGAGRGGARLDQRTAPRR